MVTVAERLAEIEERYGRTSLVVRALDQARETILTMVERTEARRRVSERSLTHPRSAGTGTVDLDVIVGLTVLARMPAASTLRRRTA
jgi:hypothetical protein